MPGKSTLPRGNVQLIYILSVAITPANLAANTTAEQTVSVPGLVAGDLVRVQKPTHTVGLVVGNARVSATDTLAVQFANVTTGALNSNPSESYLVEVIRFEDVPSTPPAGII